MILEICLFFYNVSSSMSAQDAFKLDCKFKQIENKNKNNENFLVLEIFISLPPRNVNKKVGNQCDYKNAP